MGNLEPVRVLGREPEQAYRRGRPGLLGHACVGPVRTQDAPLHVKPKGFGEEGRAVRNPFVIHISTIGIQDHWSRVVDDVIFRHGRNDLNRDQSISGQGSCGERRRPATDLLHA